MEGSFRGMRWLKGLRPQSLAIALAETLLFSHSYTFSYCFSAYFMLLPIFLYGVIGSCHGRTLYRNSGDQVPLAPPVIDWPIKSGAATRKE